MKKILITGSHGFIGKNLVMTLEHLDYEILKFDSSDSLETLETHVKACDFVVHLAGVNRPDHVEAFYEGNVNLTKSLIDMLESQNNLVPLLITSSIQAENDSDYGQSKRAGERLVENYKGKSYIFRLSNVYGKWSKPNYNSVIATWCHNINHDIELKVTDPNIIIPFVYIDDVVKDIMKAINNELIIETKYHEVKPIDTVSLGDVKSLLESFKETKNNLHFPNQHTRFAKNLYSTYLSYIPVDKMSYELTMHQDNRGSFTEFIKDLELGQISVNISKPGITKGQHWHHSKNEKFLVVSGKGMIQLRHVITDAYHEYKVSSEKLTVVDIPTGYTHNIINTGNTDMVTIMWANEVFDPNNMDTYFMEV